MLEKEFEGFPGEEKVKRGEFRMLDAQSYNQTLTERNWGRSVFPGSKIVMSILMESLTVGYDRCFRDGCTGKLDEIRHCQAIW
jgi:hypothetical protein